MTGIADSSAFRDRERLLSQHQAALTLLQARLSTPGAPQLRWLDLACGRGQIIVSLDDELYRKLIVEVSDPQMTAATLTSAATAFARTRSARA